MSLDETKKINRITLNGVDLNVVGVPSLQEKTATENGEVIADEEFDGLSKVVVNVTPPQPNLIEKEITENGTYNASDDGGDGYSSVIVNVAGGSGGEDIGDGKYEVIVYDYDGTVLKHKRLNTGDVFTLPDLPTHHERLIATGFCATTSIVDNQIVIEDRDVAVGVLYDTKSGKTEIDVNITQASGLNIKLNGLSSNGIDWGDGVTDTATSHTYAEYGKYTIMCDTTYLNTSSSSGIFGQTSSSPNLTVTEMRMSSKVTGRILCNYCYALQTVVMSPNTTAAWLDNCFEACFSLKHITLARPNGAVGLGSFCKQCYSLKSAVLGTGITSITGNDVFANTALRSFVIPDGCTSIENERFYSSVYSLERISMPDTITKIGASMAYYSYNVKYIRVSKNLAQLNSGFMQNAVQYTGIIDFSHFENIPTMASAYVFQYLNPLAKIVVPDALYDSWITANNWSTYASYIYKASEVVE